MERLTRQAVCRTTSQGLRCSSSRLSKAVKEAFPQGGIQARHHKSSMQPATPKGTEQQPSERAACQGAWHEKQPKGGTAERKDSPGHCYSQPPTPTVVKRACQRPGETECQPCQGECCTDQPPEHGEQQSTQAADKTLQTRRLMHTHAAAMCYPSPSDSHIATWCTPLSLDRPSRSLFALACRKLPSSRKGRGPIHVRQAQPVNRGCVSQPTAMMLYNPLPRDFPSL